MKKVANFAIIIVILLIVAIIGLSFVGCKQATPATTIAATAATTITTAATTTATTVSTTTAAVNAVNFIIWGDDSGLGRPGGRVNGRTDMNLLVHLNLDTNKAIIVSIPRDSWAPIPGKSTQKINGAHAIGGNDLAVATFEQFTGIKLDFYVITDMDGFVPLIDYLGGVTTTVEENIADSYSGSYLNIGTHTLNGTEALALCRARHGRTLYGGGTYSREHQAGMLIADLLIQKRGMANISNIGEVLKWLSKYVWSNISIGQALKILPTLLSIGRKDITVTTFPSYPQNFGAASAVGYDEATKDEFFSNIAVQ